MKGIIWTMLCGVGIIAIERTRPADCPPKMEIGQTYAQIKLACPDMASQSFDRDPGTGTTMYLCPSQHVVVVGSVRTGKVVALMLDVAQ